MAFGQEGARPPQHPLIELCNAVSMTYANPIAVLDGRAPQFEVRRE